MKRKAWQSLAERENLLGGDLEVVGDEPKFWRGRLEQITLGKDEIRFYCTWGGVRSSRDPKWHQPP
jgi:hypothetical protein